MKIQKNDLYHGCALAQIVKHPAFTSLNRVNDQKYGHYQINHNSRLLVKHAAGEKTPWTFTLRPDHIDTIIEDIDSDQRSFLCLICGQETICLISTEQFEQLIDTASKSEQWIKVEYKSQSSMRVSGSIGQLPSPVPHKAFPDKIFEILN